MTPPPGAFRWTTLLATGVVVLGGAAGFVLWHQMTAEPGGLPAAATPGPADRSAPRRVAPPAGLDASEAARLRRLVDACVEGGGGSSRSDVRDAVVREGEAALPFLLDAVAKVVEGPPGLETPEGILRLHRLDRPLTAIRRQVSPADPAPPWRSLPDAAWARSRAVAWFAWWDALERARRGR